MTTMPVTIQERIPMPLDVAARPGPLGATLTVGDVIRILKQRLFLILFIWATVTGGTIGLTYYLLREYPLYKAQAAVFVESPFPKTPLQLGESRLDVELMNRYVADQAVLLKDDSVLNEVLLDGAIRATAWFGSQTSPDNAMEALKDDLEVVQIPKTSYLAVSFATKLKEDAPIVVNTTIDKYLAKVQSISRLQYENEIEDYEKTRSLLEENLKRIRNEKQTFVSSQLSVPGVTEGLNVVGETWRALAAEVTRLEAEKLQYKAAYENLVGVDPSQLTISPQMRLMIEQDPQVTALRNGTLTLEQSLLIRQQQGLGENHREVRDLQSQLDVLDQQLLQVRAQKEQEVRDYQVNSAQTMYLNATQAEIQLRDRMLESEAKQRDLDRGLARYRSLEEEQLLLEEQFTRISDYVSQLRMVMQARGMVRVRKVGQALKPRTRHFPKWEYNIPAGVTLGLMLGLGLALLLELVDTSVKTSRDIVRHVHVPILGTVPDLDDEEVPIDQIELACHTAPRSMIAEAFRTIRTNLLLSSPAEQQRSVLVTSSQPEEGKTSVAVNLAISIAQSGRRVLLVDANFHRPMLHLVFPKARRHEGLSNVLIGQARVADLVSPTDLPNLDLLTTGPIPPNPTELLAGAYLQEMIIQAVERCDQIIFDGPPVLLVSDVLAMSGSVDGVVLVCRAKSSSRGKVLRAREQLERVNAHIFGAVLNAARISRGGYFREQMRTYYDYRPEEALAVETSPALTRDDQAADPNEAPNQDSTGDPNRNGEADPDSSQA